MTNGYLANSFDLLNVRDLDLIAQARRYCSRLVVGVFSDDFAASLYGRPPVVPLAERLTLVSHVRGVNEAVVHDASTVVPDHDVTRFVVAGDVPLPFAGTSWLLQPMRSTASAALREALLLLTHQEVA
jgi:glycerol-3-phosphate cytidylyltransferase-like family protein